MSQSNKILDKEAKIQCQWCGKEDTLKKWNDTTYEQCKNREMKRLYMSVTDTRAYAKNSGKFYKCPNCGQWLKGSQLIINSTNISLSKLGREPIIQLNKEGEGDEEE